MPHPRVAAPCPDCACPSCPCRVCLTVTGCGVGITADWGVYTASDCSGTPIVTGHYDGVTPSCFCLPASGIYYIAATPTGAASSTYRPRCYLLDVTDEDCAGEKDVAIAVPPYKYTVGIKVGGKPDPGRIGCSGDYLQCYCDVPGVTVRYQDGVNDVTDVTDSNGEVSFVDLNTPDIGASYTITVSGLDCGFDLPATFTGTVDVCGMYKLVTLDAASGFEYMASCFHPLPTSLYLDIYGGTTTLSYAGSASGYDYWDGCTGLSCSSRVMPVTCTFDEPQPPEDYYRYQISSGTVYVKFRLRIGAAFDATSHSTCGSTVSHQLEVYGVTASPLCVPDGITRLAYKTWRFLGGSVSNPANWVQDTWDCSTVPSVGGVTVASDSGTWTDFCACGGFSIAGSVASADSIPCAADDYTLRY